MTFNACHSNVPVVASSWLRNKYRDQLSENLSRWQTLYDKLVAKTPTVMLKSGSEVTVSPVVVALRDVKVEVRDDCRC